MNRREAQGRRKNNSHISRDISFLVPIDHTLSFLASAWCLRGKRGGEGRGGEGRGGEGRGGDQKSHAQAKR